MKVRLFILLLFIASCRNSKPVDNITAPDTLYVKADVSNSIPEKPDNSLHTIKDVSISDIPYQKPTLLARIFKSDSPKKVKYKNVTIIHQVAGGNIEAVTTDAPKKTISKDKPVEKLKGQNAIKGDGNTAEASKSDKSLLMAVGIGIVAVALFLFFWLRKKSKPL